MREVRRRRHPLDPQMPLSLHRREFPKAVDEEFVDFLLLSAGYVALAGFVVGWVWFALVVVEAFSGLNVAP